MEKQNLFFFFLLLHLIWQLWCGSINRVWAERQEKGGDSSHVDADLENDLLLIIKTWLN